MRPQKSWGCWATSSGPGRMPWMSRAAKIRAMDALPGIPSVNNGAASSSFIPLLTLGIPGNASIALIFAALLIHGIRPGPLLVAQQPQLFWGLIASMYIGNVMLLVLNLPLIRVWVRLLQVPYG